jgi:hypothetical protein
MNDRQRGRSGRTVLDEISARGDWRRVSSLYEQFALNAATHHDGAVTAMIHSELAEALARTFANYGGREAVFLADLLDLWVAIEGLDVSYAESFRVLYKDIRLKTRPYVESSDGRRRPKPFEAAVETVRRIQDLNSIRDVLEGCGTSAILGGSLSYGRFFNTCGASDKPSDIDLLLVVESYDQLGDVTEHLAGLGFVDRRSVAAMRSRVTPFLEHRAGLPRCVFRQKIKLWEDRASEYLFPYQVPGHYQLALHVVSVDDFDYITLRDIPAIHDSTLTSARSLVEFRDDAPRTDFDERRSFSGAARSVEVRWKDARGGYLVEMTTCEVIDGSFHPGVHLNLILPRFEVRWEAPGTRIRLSLLALHWKLVARVEDEQRAWGGIRKLSLSHTRHAVFSPHVLSRIDRE